MMKRLGNLAWASRLVLIAGLILAPLAATAQNLFDPVVRVNDKVITTYELSQRMAFLQLLNAPGNLRELALDQLIEERLQLEVAQSMGLEATEEQVAAGMEEFAARAQLSTEQFVTAIAQGGVAKETFRDFVSAGMVWREVVRARFAPRVQISEDEVDRALALTQPGTGVRVLLSEIYIPVTDRDSQSRATALATRISEYTTLPAFAAAARKYSASPTAGRGGRLDWLDLSSLPPQIAAMVLPLAPGEVTEPIPTGNAVALFQMRGLEEVDTPEPEDVSIEYAAFYIPGGRTPAALAEANKIRTRVDTCDDLYGIAKGLPEDRLARETLPLAEVAPDIALELAKLDEGESSVALTRGNGETLMFLMLCGRTKILPEEVSRDDIRAQLIDQRLNAYAESFLEELRADAFIETSDEGS